jgi:hypothetical protein
MANSKGNGLKNQYAELTKVYEPSTNQVRDDNECLTGASSGLIHKFHMNTANIHFCEKNGKTE